MMEPTTPLQPNPEAFNWLWGYFIPLGLLMLIWGGLTPRKARRVTPLAALSLALAIVGYWAVGFAFHMGGAYAVNPGDPSLQGLQRLFSIVPNDPGWGVIGMAGFFLSGDAATSTVLGLFLAYLPLIATGVLLVTLALAETRRWLMVTAAGLTGAFIVPVAASWMWGSGWLAHLGRTMDLGQGFVDFGGSTLILWLPGMVVLPILLLQKRADVTSDAPPPPNHFPLFAHLGALLLGIGWLGWGLSQPFHLTGVSLDGQRAAVNVLLGMAGAVLTAQLYAWLATGEPGALLAAQGLGAGWGTVLASAPFVPSWGALGIGLLAGLLFPLVHYLIHRFLRLRDAAAAVALALTSGPLGALAVAILADGRTGQGWNAMGVPADAAEGVAGLFANGDIGQLSAQLVGLLAIGGWGLVWGGVLGVVAAPQRPGQLFGIGLAALRPERRTASDQATAVAPPDTQGETVGDGGADVASSDGVVVATHAEAESAVRSLSVEDVAPTIETGVTDSPDERQESADAVDERTDDAQDTAVGLVGEDWVA